MPLAQLKPVLLGMLGGAAPPRLAPAEWEALDAMASQHRLQPLLAWRLGQAERDWSLPAGLADRWQAARHRAGMASLAQQAALRLATGHLDAAGIRCCVLKGPRLAWGCYPEPGLRPMRDIDLLVPEADVLRAAAVLGEAGFAMAAGAAALSGELDDDKHLPLLWHDGLGVAVELHRRLSDLPKRHGYHVPQLDSAAMLARSERVSLNGLPARCPLPDDLLAHLMVHALYGHRLDCGPLVLADIHFLLATGQVDAAGLWQQARGGGWERGAALLLALTERYFGPQPLAPSEAAAPPPERIVATAEEALLQELATRDHAETLADLLAARSLAALAGALVKRLRPDRQVIEAEGGGRRAWRFWPVWVWGRLRRLISRIGDPRARREASHAAALVRWLQS